MFTFCMQSFSGFERQLNFGKRFHWIVIKSNLISTSGPVFDTLFKGRESVREGSFQIRLRKQGPLRLRSKREIPTKEICRICGRGRQRNFCSWLLWDAWGRCHDETQVVCVINWEFLMRKRFHETAELQKCTFASIWFWYRDHSLLFFLCVALFCGLSPATCTTSFCYLFLLALFFLVDEERKKKAFLSLDICSLVKADRTEKE